MTALSTETILQRHNVSQQASFRDQSLDQCRMQSVLVILRERHLEMNSVNMLTTSIVLYQLLMSTAERFKQSIFSNLTFNLKKAVEIIFVDSMQRQSVQLPRSGIPHVRSLMGITSQLVIGQRTHFQCDQFCCTALGILRTATHGVPQSSLSRVQISRNCQTSARSQGVVRFHQLYIVVLEVNCYLGPR